MKLGTLDTRGFSEDEVLFFIRIKGKEHFFDSVYGRETVESVFPGFTTHRTISEYPNADHLIAFDENALADLTSADYEIYNRHVLEHVPSIIARCRGLRGIPFDEAKELILLHTKFFGEFFRRQPYRLLVIHVIDNYVLDVMVRIATVFGVQTLCLAPFFLKGYRRHTLYGEYVWTREPASDEIEMMFGHFKKGHKAFWLDGLSRLSQLRFSIYLAGSYAARYLLRYLLGYKVMGNRSYEFRSSRARGAGSAAHGARKREPGRRLPPATSGQT